MRHRHDDSVLDGIHHSAAKHAQRRMERIAGIDVARAFAIFGMMTAHFTAWGGDSMFPESLRAFDWLADGYPASLFAVLAGVSLSIMATKDSAQPALSNQKLLLRGAILLCIGFLVDPFTEVSVVLSSIGLIFLVLFSAPRWRSRTIIWVMIPLALLSILCSFAGILGAPYSYPAWLLYGLTGVLIHRHMLQRLEHRSTLVAMILFIVLGALVTFFLLPLRAPEILSSHTTAHIYSFLHPESLTHPLLYGFAPHSGGLMDLIATLFFALGMISLCVLFTTPRLLARITLPLLYPLRSVGAMALTIYVAHLVSLNMMEYGLTGSTAVGGTYEAITWELSEHEGYGTAEPEAVDTSGSSAESAATAGESTTDDASEPPATQALPIDSSAEEVINPEVAATKGYIISIIVALVFASLWRCFYMRGPLEALVARIIRLSLRN